jgi:mannose-6-phosphate isomerase-like protein (cupin superfamily)
MRALLIGLIAFALPAALAQQTGQLPALPAGVTVWQKGVPPHGIEQKDNYGNHILSISHREKSGEVEIHENKADVMIVQSGTATLVVGGKGLNLHRIAPNELHGSGIEGGDKIEVGPGDVIHIPVGTPHQFLLKPGTQITYMLVKIVTS